MEESYACCQRRGESVASSNPSELHGVVGKGEGVGVQLVDRCNNVTNERVCYGLMISVGFRREDSWSLGKGIPHGDGDITSEVVVGAHCAWRNVSWDVGYWED